jgi:hypothetical protein
MSEWKPIETATPDERVLMFCRTKYIEYMEVAEVHEHAGVRFKLQADGSVVKLDATHWMPLPDRPAHSAAPVTAER